MAQSALTVTTENPTPPTNLVFVGATPPLDLTQPVADDGIAEATPNARSLAAANGNTLNEPSGSRVVFAASTAAAGSGTSATHEGRGNETLFTQTYSAAILAPIVLTTDGCGPALTQGTSPNPNALHASGVAAALTPTITGAPSPNNSASGPGTIAITLTGTNYSPTSKVYIDGILQNSVYVSATSLTVANAPKRISAGTRSVTVTNGFNGPSSTASTWTFV